VYFVIIYKYGDQMHNLASTLCTKTLGTTLNIPVLFRHALTSQCRWNMCYLQARLPC